MRISPNIFRVCSEWVSDPHENEYQNLEEAIHDITVDVNETMIQLCSNLTDTRTIEARNKVKIIIDGQGQHTLEFRDEIVALARDIKLSFHNIPKITGQILTIRGDSILNFFNCPNIITTIEAAEGKFSEININSSKLTGVRERPAIKIINKDVKLNINNSTVVGEDHCSPIQIDGDSEENIRLENTLLLHSNEIPPINIDPETKVVVYAYNCDGSIQFCEPLDTKIES